MATVVEWATQNGRYRYRRITAVLRWEGWKVNHKRVERIRRQEGLKVPSRQPKRRRLCLNDGSYVRLRAAHKDHVWSYDFVHERTHDGRAFRLLTILGKCLAIEVKRQMNHQDVLDRLAELFVRSTTSFGLTAPWPIGLRRRRQTSQVAGTESYPWSGLQRIPGLA